MDAQIGKPVDSLQELFGYNFVSRELDAEKTAYTWIWVYSDITPGYETPTVVDTYRSDTFKQTTIVPGTYFPPTPYEEQCEFSFVAGSDGTTESWRAHGAACAIFPQAVKPLGSALQ